jgi:hypothetical protein
MTTRDADIAPTPQELMMTKLVLAAVAAVALALPAYAQTTSGSGQSAGGPANELNSPTGGPPRVTVTPGQQQQPSFQRGSGQSAGGPANELNSETGGMPRTTGSTAPAPRMGSGQDAGGPLGGAQTR